MQHSSPISLILSASKNGRWWQFNLRSLLVFTLMIALGLGYYTRVRDQAMAIHQWREMEGSAYYDYQVKASADAIETKYELKPVGWIESALGDNFYHQILKLENESIEPRATPNQVEAFWRLGTQLKGLISLRAPYQMIPPRQLEALSRNRSLLDLEIESFGREASFSAEYWRAIGKHRELRFLDVDLSAEGIEHLAKLDSLRSLRIGRPLDCDSIQIVAQLTQLEKVNIEVDATCSSGLKSILSFPKLQSLSIEAPTCVSWNFESLREAGHVSPLDFLSLRVPDLTDDQARIFSSFKKLRVFCIDNAQIKGMTFASLIEWPNLERVWFSNCPLSVEGLNAVVALPKLNTLHVRRCKFDKSLLRAVDWGNKPLDLDLVHTSLDDETMLFLLNRRNIKSIKVGSRTGFRFPTPLPQELANKIKIEPRFCP